MSARPVRNKRKRKNTHRDQDAPRVVATGTSWRVPAIILILGTAVLIVGLIRYWQRPALELPMPTADAQVELEIPMPAADAQVEAVLEQRITAHVQAVVERPNDAQAHGLLGNLYAGNGFPHLAMPCYAKAASLDPSNSRWLYYWANLARTTGLAREAEETLRKVIALEPDYAPAHEQLAWLLLDRNAMDEAARIFELVIRLRADNAGGYVGLANIRLSRDENQSAVDLLLRATEMAPHRADIHYLLARAYRKLGRLNEAQRELTSARGGGEAMVVDPWLASIGRAGVTYPARAMTAVALVKQGRVSEAVPIFEKLLVERPSEIHILDHLASAYKSLGRADDALDLLKRALALREDFFQTHSSIAVVLGELGDLAGALQHAERATQLAPNLAKPFVTKALILSKLGRYDEALLSVRRAYRLQPQDPEVNVRLGDVLRESRRWGEALTAYSKAIELKSDSILAWIRVGEIYYRLGRYDRAVTNFRAALDIDPNDQQVRRLLQYAESRLARRQ